MKKNLAKRIVLGLLTGAVLMSSSVAWAETNYSVYTFDTHPNSFGVGYSNKDDSDPSINPGTITQGSSNSIVIGINSEVQGMNSIVLGNNAKVIGLNSVALGYGSVASEGNVVSVGVADDPGTPTDEGVYRKIVNVKDGSINVDSHEAVTGGQLYDAYGIGKEFINNNGSDLIKGKNLTQAVVALDEKVKNISAPDLKAYAKTADVYTKADADKTFVKISSNVAGTNQPQISVDANGQMVFGSTSSWIDGKGEGFFAGRIDPNEDHTAANSQASITSDGSIKGASGKFIVDGVTGNLGIGDGTKPTFGIEAKTGNVTANGDVYVGGALVVGSNFAVDSVSGNVKANALDAAVDVFANGKSLVATANQVEDNKQAIEGKADKATTLEGYGITDAYTKTEVDNKIDGGSAAIAGLNQRLEKTNAKINKVGAGAAALAALHPLDYDPDDKLTFSAGMGNYAGENAAALGAFYRPNEKFMLSLGGTMGNGENMVNLGLSIGLDRASGLAKLSKKELIQKVNAVEAENDALEDRVAKLEALVAQLASK